MTTTKEKVKFWVQVVAVFAAIYVVLPAVIGGGTVWAVACGTAVVYGLSVRAHVLERGATTKGLWRLPDASWWGWRIFPRPSRNVKK